MDNKNKTLYESLKSLELELKKHIESFDNFDEAGKIVESSFEKITECSRLLKKVFVKMENFPKASESMLKNLDDIVKVLQKIDISDQLADHTKDISDKIEAYLDSSEEKFNKLSKGFDKSYERFVELDGKVVTSQEKNKNQIKDLEANTTKQIKESNESMKKNLMGAVVFILVVMYFMIESFGGSLN